MLQVEKIRKMATQMILQVAILILTAAMFYAIHYIPKRTLTKIRAKNRTSLQSNRHLVQASKFLVRAQTTTNRTQSQTLAKSALTEAEAAISLYPKDAAAHILRARALVLLGRRAAALRSFDLALLHPRVRSIAVGERVEALVERAELRMTVNMRRRVDSAVDDLEEALRLSHGGGKSATAFCSLGRCYEFKGLKERARRAFQEALRIEPEHVTACDGLDRVGA